MQPSLLKLSVRGTCDECVTEIYLSVSININISVSTGYTNPDPHFGSVALQQSFEAMCLTIILVYILTITYYYI